jgi:hypothetical protein|tara:strand:+ start:391 stop:570 length:180 start_codon:yes stop_codon:yes gene_type:complete
MKTQIQQCEKRSRVIPARSFYTFLTDEELKQIISDGITEYKKRGKIFKRLYDILSISPK